jgi:hypothetical protein
VSVGVIEPKVTEDYSNLLLIKVKYSNNKQSGVKIGYVEY